MTATTTTRLKDFKGPYPNVGTYPMPANTRILKGTIVQLNASDQAIPGADGNGFPAIGFSSANYDNTTGSEAGGGAGDLSAQVEYGVFGWFGEAGSLPTVGDVCYVADNQTVSTDSDSAQRGIAGRCVEVRDSKYYVYMGPHVSLGITEAAAVAAGLASAVVDIGALEVSALSAQRQINIPITAWTDSGAPLLAFVDGSVNGLALVDSEALGFRFGPVGEDTSVLATSIAMPQDLDDSEDVVVHVLAFRVGSADTTAVLAVGAFFQTVGAAHTADADAGGNTAALTAATTIVAEYTVTIDAADVPAAPCALTLTIAPDAALDADDVVVVATWIEYTSALLTS